MLSVLRKRRPDTADRRGVHWGSHCAPEAMLSACEMALSSNAVT